MSIEATHLITGAAGHSRLFLDDEDRWDFLERTRDALKAAVLEYALQPTHAHILAEGPAEHLQRWLEHALLGYRRAFARRHPGCEVRLLLEQARKRFENQRPTKVFRYGRDRVEIWDADDFDPWDALNWKTVRVFRYRQHKPDGTVVEAYWLTNFTRAEASPEELFACAKNRWEIENQGFNDGKNRYGMEYIRHHEKNSVLVGWLISALAMIIERLYRCRYLHRGSRPIMSAIELLRDLRLALGVWHHLLKANPHLDTS